MEIFFVVFLSVLIAWTIWGFASSRVEQMEYKVLKRANGYEIREYPMHIVAQTTVAGSYDDALQEGFRIVAGYIFGGNTEKERISMTAPVVAQRPRNRSIAMTAPVTASIEGEAHTVAFGMPRSYTLATLPVPNDPRVTVVEIPKRKMAARRFSMWRTNARVQYETKELVSALARDAMTVVGEPQYAGYNAPWTPPWMMRNEVLVEIQ